MLILFNAETYISIFSSVLSSSAIESHLFPTTIHLFSFIFSKNSSSSSLNLLPASTTKSIRSALSIYSRLFSTLKFPRLLLSSSPGVSTSTTGPKGKSSILFFTGSVVVPLISDTIAMSCEVIAFIKLDFPTLQRPKRQIVALSPIGVLFISEPEIPCICSLNFIYILNRSFLYLRITYLFNLRFYHLHSMLFGLI